MLSVGWHVPVGSVDSMAHPIPDVGQERPLHLPVTGNYVRSRLV